MNFCNKYFKNPKVFIKNAVMHVTGKTIRTDTDMGMAASQARLLQITARMHDIEFKAQSIEDAKISLATQRDELYKDYCLKYCQNDSK